MEIRLNCFDTIELNGFKKLEMIQLNVLSYNLKDDTLKGDVKINGEYLKGDETTGKNFEDLIPFTIVFRSSNISIDKVSIENVTGIIGVQGLISSRSLSRFQGIAQRTCEGTHQVCSHGQRRMSRPGPESFACGLSGRCGDIFGRLLVLAADIAFGDLVDTLGPILVKQFCCPQPGIALYQRIIRPGEQLLPALLLLFRHIGDQRLFVLFRPALQFFQVRIHNGLVLGLLFLLFEIAAPAIFLF